MGARRLSSASSGDEYLSEAEFRAWHGALQFANAAVRELDEALSSEHGISVTEFDVLITLFNAPSHRLRMTELAHAVVFTPSGLTHLVARLEKQGLVARVVDEHDRRSFFAELTRAGQKCLRDARPTHNEVIRERLTRRLTAKQLDELGDIWERVERGR